MANTNAAMPVGKRQSSQSIHCLDDRRRLCTISFHIHLHSLCKGLGRRVGLTKREVQSLAIFYEQDMLFAACICDEMIPSCVNYLMQGENHLTCPKVLWKAVMAAYLLSCCHRFYFINVLPPSV